MPDPRDDLIRRKKFDPTMCRNCSHERSAHAGCSDWDACLQCETCDQYVALGQKLADEMNAVEVREFPEPRP